MTIVRSDTTGLQRAWNELHAGRPVIMPLPTPLPYAVAGLEASVVNLAKRRPAEQTTGMVVADFSVVSPYVDLDADTLALANWLAADQLLNLLLPTTPGGPGWLLPSTSNGWLGVTLACLDQTRALWDRLGRFYVSSANRTGSPVTTTAAAANAAFADALLVVDADAARDPYTASGSATMIRVGPRRHLQVARHGIHDIAFESDANGFLRHLTHRWERDRRPEPPSAAE